jgi:hypothetical protein
VRAVGSEPVELLLRAGDGVGREPGTHGEDRPGVHGPSVPWQSRHDGLAAARRARDQSQTGAAADAVDGSGSGVSEAAIVGRRSRPPGLSVSASERVDRARGPGVEHGYHVYSAAERVHVPDGGDGLVQPLRAVVAAVEHAGRGVLSGGAGGGIEPRQARGVQYGPGGSVHVVVIHDSGGVVGREGEHGRPGSMPGQRVRGAFVADGEV